MTNAQMTRSTDSTKKNNLYISFELSNTKWLLLLSDGIKRRQKTIEAGNIIELKIEIDKSINVISDLILFQNQGKKPSQNQG